MPDHVALRFMSFVFETRAYMVKKSVQLVNHLRDIAAESGRMLKGTFERWAMQLLPVSEPRGA